MNYQFGDEVAVITATDPLHPVMVRGTIKGVQGRGVKVQFRQDGFKQVRADRVDRKGYGTYVIPLADLEPYELAALDEGYEPPRVEMDPDQFYAELSREVRSLGGGFHV